MFKRLFIQNYALIESLDIVFPEGLIIITGETGAGKSILLGAVSLLLGAKCDSSVFKDSSKNCVVEGEFETDNGEILLRRVISPAGRSRCFCNDEPVSASYLSEISSSLIDIHEQHKHLLLSKKDFQLEVLDTYCSNYKLLENYQDFYEKNLQLNRELEQLEKTAQENEKEREYIEFQLNKLTEANLKEGEEEELENIQKRLANGEQIRESYLTALQLLNNEENSLIQIFKQVEQNISKTLDFIPEAQLLVKRVESCRIESKDIIDEIEKYSNSVESNPQLLSEIDNRLSVIYSLKKRFNCETVQELLKIQKELSGKINDNENNIEKISSLKRSIKENQESLENAANALSNSRIVGAKKLEQTLQEQIQNLEMPNAVFSISLNKLTSLSPSGIDDLQFMFAANKGNKQVEIQKVASGGELSRVMLCIKKIMGEHKGMPTMIFDEIDIGVSGKIADKMGNLLDLMGKRTQIFAITHLPQVASKGKNHILVYKDVEESDTKTKIKFIKGSDRVLEIARLLSGEQTTNEAIANAKVLLEEK